MRRTVPPTVTEIVASSTESQMSVPSFSSFVPSNPPVTLTSVTPWKVNRRRGVRTLYHEELYTSN